MKSESTAVRVARGIVGPSLMKRSLNRQLHARLKSVAEALPHSARILDVGAKQAPYRDFFRHHTFQTVDVSPVASPDYVADIHTLSTVVPESSFDLVICTEVLEHVRQPWTAVDEIHRVLKPGGLLLATTPFIVPYHPDPTDYWRLTEETWRDLLSKWTEKTVKRHGNAILALWYLAGAGALKPLRLLDRLVFALFRRMRAGHVFLGIVVEARK